MNGWKQYKAHYITADSEKTIPFTAPGDADNNEIWERAQKAMLYGHGIKHVTCWELVK